MDLDLEADLGIDTVKQAEVFATIRESYGIERDDCAQAARLPDAQPRRRLRARPRSAAPPAAAPEPAPESEPARPSQSPSPEPEPQPVAEPSRAPSALPAPRARAGAAPAARALRRDRRDDRRGQPGRADARRAAASRPRSPAGWPSCGAEVLTIEGAPDVESSRRSISSGPTAARSTASTGCRRSTTRDRWPSSTPMPGAQALHVRVKLLAAAMRAARRRARRSWSAAPASAAATATTRTARRSVLGGAVTGFTKALSQERPRHAGQGGRLRPGARPGGHGRRRCSRRRCATRARSRSATPTGCGGRSRWWSSPPSTSQQREPGAATPCSWSPAPPAASSRRSSPTWPPRRARTFHLLDLVPAPDPHRSGSGQRSTPTAKGSQRDTRRADPRARRPADAEARSSASWPGSSGPERPSTRSRRSNARAARRTGTRST